MSKAFTKETDNDGDDEGMDEVPALAPGFKNYVTPAGEKKLREELRVLLYESRPEVVRTVSWAASNGDRSENGDYIYGKRRLREIDRRIRFLTKRLESIEVVDPATQPKDRVLFGATVAYVNEEGVKKKIRIVGIDEANAANGDVSWISPIAKAFLNAKPGDVIVFRSPRGEEELEITKVSYDVG